MVKTFPDDYDFWIALMKKLKKCLGLAFCRDFFSQQYAMYSKNALSNYVYAFFQSSNAKKVKLYKRALQLNPGLYQASMALGQIYIGMQEWSKAKKEYRKCLISSPNSVKLHYYLAVADIKLTGRPDPLLKYEAFLRKIGIDDSGVLKEMVALSQHMKSPKWTNIYLRKAESIPELSTFVREQRIRTKFIYNDIKKADFPAPVPSYLKFYYQIYLIEHGKSRQMMLIPTSRRAFPEFWKVFISWRTGLSSWKRGAGLILKRDSSDLLVSTIMELLLKRISPLEAAWIIDELPYQEKPLLALMVAEEYYRVGDIRNSEIFYKRALHYSPPNIYKRLVEYLIQNK